jgi:1-deoxyxylulose-5-phosphate synthase
MSISRRDFLKTAAAASLAAGAGAILPAAPAPAAKRSAADWVALGNSGVKVTRLAFGTGTRGGSVQRTLGQDEFTRLVRYAYDRGIRFFETAESYSTMPHMLGVALKGLPRDSYRLMTKIRSVQSSVPLQDRIDTMRRDMNTEYFDILLLHCVRQHGWADEFHAMRDTFSENKRKGAILAHGASVHGLLPLRDFPGNPWLDVALMRVNHDGAKMDNLRGEGSEKGDVKEVTGHIRTVRAQGTGVIGMKLVGEGTFTNAADREASLQFVMKLGTVDAVTIGYKNTAEIDEAIERIGRALNA